MGIIETFYFPSVRSEYTVFHNSHKRSHSYNNVQRLQYFPSSSVNGHVVCYKPIGDLDVFSGERSIKFPLSLLFLQFWDRAHARQVLFSYILIPTYLKNLLIYLFAIILGIHYVFLDIIPLSYMTCKYFLIRLDMFFFPALRDI